MTTIADAALVPGAEIPQGMMTVLLGGRLNSESIGDVAQAIFRACPQGEPKWLVRVADRFWLSVDDRMTNDVGAAVRLTEGAATVEAADWARYGKEEVAIIRDPEWRGPDAFVAMLNDAALYGRCACFRMEDSAAGMAALMVAANNDLSFRAIKHGRDGLYEVDAYDPAWPMGRDSFPCDRMGNPVIDVQALSRLHEKGRVAQYLETASKLADMPAFAVGAVSPKL